MSKTVCFPKNHSNTTPFVNYLETGELVSNKILIGHTTQVSSLNDFPTPVNGVIHLPADTSWVINDAIDLNGNRINCLGRVSISGQSSETCSLYSSLGNGVSLFTSSFTLPIFRITLGCSTNAQIFNLTGDGTNGLDIVSSNFGSDMLDCGSLGLVSNFSNAILNNCAFLTNADGITFSGSIGTIGIADSIFASIPTLANGNAYIYLPNTLTITRRFRVIYSSLVVITGRIGIDYTGAVIPDESMILDTVNFSGGSSSYVNGLDHLSLTTLWNNNIGITNTFISAEAFVQQNITPTTFLSSGTDVLMVATSTTDPLNLSRFSQNGLFRLTYTGVRTQACIVNLSCSVSGSANRDLHISIAKNGVVIPTTEMKSRTTGAGNFSFVATSQIVVFDTTDYVEGWIRNDTDTSNMIVEDAVLSIFSR